MKKLLPYCLILGSIVLCLLSCSPKKHSASKTTSYGVKADSGYVTEASLRTLFKINPEDTLFKNRGFFEPTDTVGKYFINRVGNYVACIDIFSTDANASSLNVFIEALPDGTIVKEVPLGVGWFRCCWAGMNESLSMHGDYFSVSICGQGTGFCSGQLFFFKDIEDVNNMHAGGLIMESVIIGLPGEEERYLDIYTQPEIHNDTIIMHYTKQLLVGKKMKVEESESFDVAYTLQPTGWAATDSTRLKEIEHYLY
jgi:hypothetical protein